MVRCARSLVVVVVVASTWTTKPAGADDVGTWLDVDKRIDFGEGSAALPSALRLEGETRLLVRTPVVDSVRMRAGAFWDWPNFRLGLNGVAIAGRSDSGGYRDELRGELEPTVLFQIGSTQITNRNRIELRSVSGDIRCRFRDRLRLRLEPEDALLWPFVSDELFAGFDGSGVVENRASFGLSVALLEGDRIDVAYLLQSQNEPEGWANTHVLTFTVLLTTKYDRARE